MTQASNITTLTMLEKHFVFLLLLKSTLKSEEYWICPIAYHKSLSLVTVIHIYLYLFVFVVGYQINFKLCTFKGAGLTVQKPNKYMIPNGKQWFKWRIAGTMGDKC